MKRMPVVAGLVVAGAIAITAYLVIISLDSLVKAAVEKYGSEITQTAVSLSSAKLKPLKAELLLRGLRIRNPRGFTSTYLLETNAIRVSLDLGTIGSETIIINEIEIVGPVVTYELGPAGSNIAALRKTISGQGSAGRQETGQGDTHHEKKLVIRHVRISQGKVKLGTSLIGDGDLTLPLPDMDLRDVGSDQAGVVPGELARELIEAVAKGVSTTVREVKLKGLLRRNDRIIHNARDMLEALGASMPEETKQAAKGLRKLFR